MEPEAGMNILIEGNPHIVVHVGTQWGAIDPGTGWAWTHQLYPDRSSFKRMLQDYVVTTLRPSSTGRR